MRLPAATAMTLLLLPPAGAEVSLDGSLGPAGTLPGPDYQISADLGREVDGNLFHSFHAFGLDAGESAHFSGSASIQNVIGRVTGGELSLINGDIHNDIPGAALVIVNPAGVVFGPQASLHTDGAFHVSTADYIDLADGERFYADRESTGGLTSAPISAFGFLDAPARIEVEGASLQVGDGESLTLVGGELTIRDASLQAAGGNIVLIAAGSSGRVGEMAGAPDLEGFEAMETVRIERTDPEDPAGESGLANVDASGDAGGGVWIRSGSLFMDGGSVFADSQVGSSLEGIDIAVDQTVELSGNSFITAENLGSGEGGSIRIAADDMNLDDTSRISTTSFGEGDAGSITVAVTDLAIDGGSGLSSSSLETGGGGDLQITAENSISVTGAGSEVIADANSDSGGSAGSIRIQTGEFELSAEALVQSATAGPGAAGTIEVVADRVEITAGGRLSTGSAGGSGHGGDILVAATESVHVTGSSTTGTRSGIVANSVGQGSGDAGYIEIETPSLVIENSGLVQSTTDGSGDAGEIELDLTTLELRQGGEISTTAVGGTGHGGRIRIDVLEEVRIEGAESPTGIAANTDTGASGDAGAIEITAPLLVMTEGGRLQSLTEGTGNAGAVQLVVGRLEMDGGAEISTTAFGDEGQGGDLIVEADNAVSIRGDSAADQHTGLFSNSGPAATGNAGLIQVTTPHLLLQDASIQSQSDGNGDAGTIVLQVGELQLLDGGQISTSTTLHGSGLGGDIFLDATGDLYICGSNAIGNPSAIVADSRSSSASVSGAAGQIGISAAALELAQGGQIVSSSSSQGDAGSIEITAGEVRLQCGGAISSTTSDAGRGGNIRVQADAELEIDGTDPEWGSTGLFSDSSGSNDGGRIVLVAPDILVTGQGMVSCLSSGDGNAGDIVVAADRLMLNSGVLTTQSDATSGGNIRISAGSTQLLGDSRVNASVFGDAETQGGNVTIRGNNLVILDTSRVTATATLGWGGYIQVDNSVFLHEPDPSTPVLDASSETLGNSGVVEVNSPDLDISGSLSVLPAVFLDASDELNRHCGAAAAGRLSSLLVRNREILPCSPERTGFPTGFDMSTP